MEIRIYRLALFISIVAFFSGGASSAYSYYQAANAQKIVILWDSQMQDYKGKCYDDATPAYLKDSACDIAKSAEVDFYAAAAARDASKAQGELYLRLALMVPLFSMFIFYSALWIITGRTPRLLFLASLQKERKITEEITAQSPLEFFKVLRQRIVRWSSAIFNRHQGKQNIRTISDRDFWISAITSHEQADKIIQRGTKDFLYLYIYYLALFVLAFLVFGNKLNTIGGSPLATISFIIVGIVLTLIVRRTGSIITAGLHMLICVLPGIVIVGALAFALIIGYLSIWLLIFNAPLLMFVALIAWTTIRIFVATKKLRGLAKQ